MVTTSCHHSAMVESGLGYLGKLKSNSIFNERNSLFNNKTSIFDLHSFAQKLFLRHEKAIFPASTKGDGGSLQCTLPPSSSWTSQWPFWFLMNTVAVYFIEKNEFGFHVFEIGLENKVSSFAELIKALCKVL